MGLWRCAGHRPLRAAVGLCGCWSDLTDCLTSSQVLNIVLFNQFSRQSGVFVLLLCSIQLTIKLLGNKTVSTFLPRNKQTVVKIVLVIHWYQLLRYSCKAHMLTGDNLSSMVVLHTTLLDTEVVLWLFDGPKHRVHNELHWKFMAGPKRMEFKCWLEASDSAYSGLLRLAHATYVGVVSDRGSKDGPRGERHY